MELRPAAVLSRIGLCTVTHEGNNVASMTLRNSSSNLNNSNSRSGSTKNSRIKNISEKMLQATRQTANPNEGTVCPVQDDCGTKARDEQRRQRLARHVQQLNSRARVSAWGSRHWRSCHARHIEQHAVIFLHEQKKIPSRTICLPL